MKKLLILAASTLLFTSAFAYAETCPMQPYNAPGWNNPFNISSGEWTSASWMNGNTMYCYYQGSSLPFPEYIYKNGVSKPTGAQWSYNAPSQSLQCTESINACNF